MRLYRGLVEIQLVEDEMQRVLAVLGDIEVLAADLVAERPFGVFLDRIQELIELVFVNLQRNDEGNPTR